MKIKLHKFLFGFSMMAGIAVSAQNYRTLSVSSGFNADVIANGVGSAASSTTIGVDNANYAFMSRDFQVSSTSPTYSYALPSSGTITAFANTALQFQLAPYTGNNVLRLQETNDTGTLTFSNPLMATRLYVAATGGSGAVTASTVVNFDDGTSQTVTGTVVPDWYYSTAQPLVTSGIGRVSRTDNGVQNESGNPRIYMYTINITSANQSKMVTGLQLTKTSAAEGALNVFAVSADAVPCTTPPSPVAVAQEYCGTTTVSQLTATGTVTGGTFRWYTLATGGSALEPTAEVTSGIYFVAQVDNICESDRVPSEVTINITPQPEGPANQTVCAEATIGDLIATGIEGGTITWTRNGESINDSTLLQSGNYNVVQTVAGCASAVKTINVTVGLSTPIADAEQTLCAGSVVGDLAVTTIENATVQYYLVGFILQEVQPTDALISGARYSITQSLTDCTSGSAYVEATLVDAPAEPESEATQTFNVGETVSTLDIVVEDEATVTWYILNDGEYVAIPDDTFLEDGVTYYAAQSVVAGCTSPYHAITATTVAATSNEAFKNLKVYPNPATNLINIDNTNTVSRIVVNNVLGQKIIDQNANGSSVQLDIAGLLSGTYIVQLHTATGLATVKIVKQ